MTGHLGPKWHWQLNISIPKCVVLRLGNRNVSFTYNFNNLTLPNVSVVRDLGVLIDNDLKFSSHIEAMITKAHQRASLILRCFKCRDPFLLYRVFITYVRPILKYNCQVWSPAYFYIL